MTMTDAQMLELFRTRRGAPPTAKLMSFELLDLSIEGGWVEAAFTSKPEFCNPFGNVQGGFITAMIDDAMAVAAVVKSGLTKVVPTLQLSITFLVPVPVGRVFVRGEVLRLGKANAQLAGTLRLADGTLAAVATASAAVRDMPQMPKG